MIISQTAEYAIRAMSAIATLPRGIKIRATDLGSGTGIPAPYLSKILRRLVLAGLLDSQNGAGAGNGAPGGLRRLWIRANRL